MYELHFGLTGPPFRLNPDPSFYYGSKGHSHALAYLKYGLHQGEGFIVVTGEIGAGKTTVVRTLLEELDTTSVIAAHIVSTQLESGELLRSILTAYGVRAVRDSKAHVIATLEAFLTTVAAQGKRALLIVDEAQNLQREAIEELRMLSNFQLGNHALLQSFLVGQPELRLLLKSRAMEQLRQRVIASCHIEPLDLADTRNYIEHRLHHVGWQGRPQFGPMAFERIFHSTGGVPRRINRLCNRLLLAAYLNDVSEISEDLVRETATELRLEISEVGEMPALDLDLGAPGGHVASAAAEPDTLRDRVAQTGPRDVPAQQNAGALMCLCDTPAGLWRSVAVAQAGRSLADAIPLTIVYCGSDGYSPSRGLDARLLPAACPVVQLHLDEQPFIDLVAAAALKLESMLTSSASSAVVSHGASDALLICTLVAKKNELDVLRLDAGRRGKGDSLNPFLLDHLGDALYAETIADRDALLCEGVPSQKAHQVGSLASSVIHFAWPMLSDERETLALFGLSPAALSRKPYALLTCRLPKGSDWSTAMSPVLPVLRVLSRGKRLVWPLDQDNLAIIRSTSLANQLSEHGVILVEERGYLDALGLLRHALCLIHCERRDLADEALALGKPVVALGDIGARDAARKGSVSAGALTVDQATRIAKSIPSVPREEAKARDAFDSGAGARVARLWKHWLRERQPAAATSVESLR